MNGFVILMAWLPCLYCAARSLRLWWRWFVRDDAIDRVEAGLWLMLSGGLAVGLWVTT